VLLWNFGRSKTRELFDKHLQEIELFSVPSFYYFGSLFLVYTYAVYSANVEIK